MMGMLKQYKNIATIRPTHHIKERDSIVVCTIQEETFGKPDGIPKSQCEQITQAWLSPLN